MHKKYFILSMNKFAFQHTIHIYLPNQHRMKKDLIRNDCF